MVAVTFCTSGAVLAKAGAEADFVSGAVLLGTNNSVIDEWITEAESEINTICRFNFTDVYTASLNDDVKKILQGVCSDLAAIKAIIYRLSDYNSRIEAEDKINVLRDSALRGLAILRDKKAQDFINAA